MNPFLQSPGLGYTREFNHKLFQSLEAWFSLQQASFDYQLVLLEVWLKSIEEFLRVLLTLTENGETIQHWQPLLQVWSQLFDRTFEQTFQSDRALQRQGKFLKAAITFRQQQQQLMNTVLKWNDLPTRSEVDEIHRNIYELRKEMKCLKQAFAELQNQESDRAYHHERR
jgi:class III poly(R)-hydroxyalkanoic acid synthase PhaE subunit